MLRKNLLNTDHESHMQVSTTNYLQIYSRTIKIKNYNDTENLHLFFKANNNTSRGEKVKCTLFNFPRAEIRSAHSLEYSKLLSAFSTALIN